MLDLYQVQKLKVEELRDECLNQQKYATKKNRKHNHKSPQKRLSFFFHRKTA